MKGDDDVNEVIQDWPAWTIVKAPRVKFEGLGEGAVFKAGETVAMPFRKLGGGAPLYRFFQFNSVVSYALETGRCPIRAVEQQRALGHELHWLNRLPVTLTSRRETPKRRIFAVNWGDTVIFEGRAFRVRQTPNDNAALLPL